MTTGAPIQRQYRRYEQEGWPGALARPNEPHAFHFGLIDVPTGATRTPRPGDPVYWDATAERYAIPTTAVQVEAVCGILVFDSGTVQGTLDSVPSNANSDAFVEYKDNDSVKVGVMGTFYAIAGEALNYDVLVEWDIANYKWDVRATAQAAAHTALTGNTVANINAGLTQVIGLVNTAFGDLRRKPIVNVSRQQVAADGLCELQIGYGRVA